MDHKHWEYLAFIPLSAIVAPAYAVEYLTVAEAQQLIFGAENRFIESTLLLDGADKKQIKKLAHVRQREDRQQFWKVMEEGRQVGWFAVDDVIGKHEYITYAVGMTMAGEVTGIEILNYRETHGGEVRQEPWRDQFDGKSLDDPLKLGKDIDNISGATLSCRNITDGVRRLLVIHRLFLSGRAGEK